MQNAITIGTKVKLIHMEDPYPVPNETIGTVTHIDDIGQIHVNWGNGSTLAILPGLDIFEILGEKDDNWQLSNNEI